MSGRRDPFKEIEELFEQLNEGFADVGRDLGEEFGGGSIHVDVAEGDDEIVVTADVPGFDPEDIDVSVSDRQLQIAAEHTEETEEQSEEEVKYYRRERSRRSVSRTVSLPTDVKEEEADASYENGVLTVTLPKTGGDGGIDIQVS
ncbi:Hsp20/alpha crystallin family protein [Halolamina salifodinae]|uniref:HSP20 family protein n=1 Tax=Halolamina salifodinae TaxID=1202767 RepID=A0A8T4GYC5_9EURY|nr:Hsp20/alpha crystallin family protein [Halolamina salifodinae]MBP1988031.1 HSP20 family protein [Halolamina salifodinae]